MSQAERGLFERIKYECFSPRDEKYMNCQEDRLGQICAEFEQRLAETNAKLAQAESVIAQKELALAAAKELLANAKKISVSRSLTIAAMQERLAEAEKVVRHAKAVNSHWNEFGPENGLDEIMHYLHEALTAPQQEPKHDSANN